MADNDIKIYGALRAMTGEGKAAYASQIYEETQQAFLSDLINNGFKGKIRIKDSAGTTVGYLGSDGTGKMNIKANESSFNLKATALINGSSQKTGELNIATSGDVTLESYDDLYLRGGTDVKVVANTDFEATAGQNATISAGSAYVKVKNSGEATMSSASGKDVRVKVGDNDTDTRLHATPNNVRLRASENCNMTVNAPVDETATPIVYNNNIRLACGDVEFYLKTFDAQGQQVGNDEIYNLRGIIRTTEKKMICSMPTYGSLNALVGHYYYFSHAENTYAITLPTMELLNTATSDIYAESIVFFIPTGTTPAITFSSTNTILYQNGFALEASKTYEINALWNGAAWVIAAVEIEIPT